jgi:hypothetical protein
MRSWLIAIGIGVVTLVLVCCLPVSQRSATDRRRHRFAAIRSPLIEEPAYRVLFLLVAIGVVLICLVPEAIFVIPTLDALGLDVVTIFVALELRHYLISAARIFAIPAIAPVYRHGPAQLVNRCRDLVRTNPVLWLYACMRLAPRYWLMS